MSDSPVTIIGSKENKDPTFIVKLALLLLECVLTPEGFIFTGQGSAHCDVVIVSFILQVT